MDEQAVTSTPSMADYYGMIKAEHEANNAWSAEQAQKAMDYQTQMSNTAHQREVADLKAAGLNPILSAGGQGATTGSGAQAQRSDSNVDALYGLAKMAIENSIVQAGAMANTAKYSSGSNGYSNPVPVALIQDPNSKKEKKTDNKSKEKKSSSSTSSSDKKKTEQVLNHVGKGNGYLSDLLYLGGKLFDVISDRSQGDVKLRVANTPNTYTKAVFFHGIDKANALIKSGSAKRISDSKNYILPKGRTVNVTGTPYVLTKRKK